MSLLIRTLILFDQNSTFMTSFNVINSYLSWPWVLWCESGVQTSHRTANLSIHVLGLVWEDLKAGSYLLDGSRYFQAGVWNHLELSFTYISVSWEALSPNTATLGFRDSTYEYGSRRDTNIQSITPHKDRVPLLRFSFPRLPTLPLAPQWIPKF